MIVRRFLLWARTAPAAQRAAATRALAGAYLGSDLSPEDRHEAETAITAMLDDTSPLVRRALSEAFAGATDVPRHVVVTLAADQSEVAAPILAGSPMLLDCDLIDCAAIGDVRAQCAIAARPWLSPALAAALAEIGSVEALCGLARNPGAEIAEFSLLRMVERHGGQAVLREALLARPGLPADVAQAIASALAQSLQSFVVGRGWLSPERSGRVAREARDRTALALSAEAEPDGIARLIGLLRRSDQLTPALILRGLLSGGSDFVEAALADLAGVSPAKAAAALRDRRGRSFRALYGRAGLPEALLPAFEAAAAAWRDLDRAKDGSIRDRLSPRLIERALASCASRSGAAHGPLLALLRRFEAEALREESRREADGLADEAALAAILRHDPQLLLEDMDGSLAA